MRGHTGNLMSRGQMVQALLPTSGFSLGPGFAKDASRGDRTMWLLLALLLFFLPGCSSLTGPSFVTGTPGSSLTVRCQYDPAYKGNNKYWCREHDKDCDRIVETKGKEKEERNGWVSIRDSPDDLAFTVTMENVNTSDAGTYWCKIQTVWILDAWSPDPSFQVRVSVCPGPCTATRRTTCLTTPAAFSGVITHQGRTHCPGVPFSTVYFLIPIFLKLPLFLSVLGVALCVRRRQRGPRGRRSRPDQGHAPRSARPPPGVPCPGAPPFRLDRETRGLCSLEQGSRSAWTPEGLEPSGAIAPVPRRKVLDLRGHAH